MVTRCNKMTAAELSTDSGSSRRIGWPQPLAIDCDMGKIDHLVEQLDRFLRASPLGRVLKIRHEACAGRWKTDLELHTRRYATLFADLQKCLVKLQPEIGIPVWKCGAPMPGLGRKHHLPCLWPSQSCSMGSSFSVTTSGCPS